MRLRTTAATVLTLAIGMTAAAQDRSSSLAGRIIAPSGMAASGARVLIYAISDDGGSRRLVTTTTSSYDGRYAVSGLEAGSYVIGVRPPNAAPDVTVETFYPDVVDVERAQPITVFAGVPVEGIDIWLAPAPQRYSVSGHVFLPPELTVRELVIEYGGPDVIRRGVWYLSDPGGPFEIEGVAQGTLVMFARAETDRGTYLGAASTQVTLESVQDVRIVMRPPGRIQGRVVFERELPDRNALRVVPVQTLLTLSALYPVQSAPVAPDGAFEIREAFGTYAFEVHGLPSGWTVKRVLRDSHRAAGDRIVVGSDEWATAVEIVVGPS